MSHVQALRKGRYKGARPATFDRRLLVVAVLLAVVCAWQLWSASSARTQDYGAAEVAAGQPVEVPNFSAGRGFINYQIAGSGRRYWYSSVAARFRVCGGWKKIVRENLKDSAGPGAVDDAQYKLEAGKVIKVPLTTCEEP
jgi:hypothetical protein